jgi:PmbA protein
VAVRPSPLADPEARLALADGVLRAAGRDAAVEVFLHHDPGLLLQYDPTDGTAEESRGEWTRAGVRVWDRGRVGVSGGTVEDVAGCLRLLDEARARAAAPGARAGAIPARGTRLAAGPPPAGGLSGGRARRMARELAGRAAGAGLRPEVVLIKQYASSSVLVSTVGARVAMWMPQEQALLRCAARAGMVADAVAEQRVDGDLDTEPLLRRLGAAARALEEAGGDPDPDLPLVLRPAIAALLAAGLGSLLRADVSGRSGLGAALGRRVFPAGLDVVDEPAPPGGMNRRLLDDEGTPARPVRLVEGGRVRALLHSTETAAALDAEANGRALRFESGMPPVPFPLNLGVLPRGEAMPASRNELVVALETTGWQTRPGTIAVNAAGWVVRDGERVRRIGPHPLDLAVVPALRRLLAVGGDVEPVPLALGSRSPSLAFEAAALHGD